MNYQAALVYYQNILKGVGAASSTPRVTQTELAVDVLDTLVEASLIDAGARAEVGSDITSLVENKISQYDNNTTLQQGIRTAYGLSYPDFRREVLVPQAEKDILASRLLFKNQKIDDWIVAARRSAKITLLSPKFRWDGGEVTSTGR